MKFTGERYVPTLDSPILAFEHWHRYLFATPWVAGKRVLDIACGEGYGSYLLAQQAVDIIEFARAEEALRTNNEELERLNRAMVGRELRMVELKKEVNELCVKAGLQPPYKLDFEKEQP